MVEFGWTNPVLVDEQGGILAGHGRLLAARKLGLAEVPVIRFEHLSEAQKRAYLIADNQLALQAGWNEELLAEELAWLRDERFDLDLIGFDASELERLLALADGEAASDEAEDEVPEPPEDPVSKPGDLWVLGNHRLLCGDATVLADVERVLGGAARRHDVLRSALQRRLRQLAEGQAARQAPADPERQSRRRLRGVPATTPASTSSASPRAPCYICMSSSELHTLQRAFRGRRRQVVDLRDLGQEHLHARPRRLSAPVRADPLRLEGRAATTTGAAPGTRATSGSSTSRSKNDLHPTMKPVALVERAIRNSSKSRDIVLDPFGGSGSTLIACEKAGRQARLIELDPKYVDTIILRWQEFSGGTAILDGDGRSYEEIAAGREAAAA